MHGGGEGSNEEWLNLAPIFFSGKAATNAPETRCPHGIVWCFDGPHVVTVAIYLRARAVAAVCVG